MKQTYNYTPTTSMERTYGDMPIPKGWHIVTKRDDGLMWERLIGERITVIESIHIEKDERRWLHVSVAKPNKKIPTYDDVQYIRKLFIGEERESYMIFPPKDRYVDINPVLHLFVCLDAPDGVLPEMEGFVNGKRTI